MQRMFSVTEGTRLTCLPRELHLMGRVSRRFLPPLKSGRNIIRVLLADFVSKAYSIMLSAHCASFHHSIIVSPEFVMVSVTKIAAAAMLFITR
jgi:hypothetical protein